MLPQKRSAFLLVAIGSWAMRGGPLLPVVELEETVYAYTNANNGAGPMWCSGSTCLARVGDRVFATGLETLPGVEPLNNCRWTLWTREASGWREVYADATGRTREPSPLAVLPGGRLVVSANPTLQPEGSRGGGPARPELWQFEVAQPAQPPVRLLPEWQGTPRFTEHSYRTWAADPVLGGSILFQNIDYTHAEWAFRDGDGRWVAAGQLKWPWGADYAKPQPIRVCYPNVAVRGRAVHFLGVSDIQEPNPAWREFKHQLTGQHWDYDFRRLFYTWSPDLSKEPFANWVEIASREKTCGWVSPCDLWVAPDGSVRVMWTERALDERLRTKFFPEARQSHGLYYGVIRDGKLAFRMAVAESTEDRPGVSGSGARFHEAPGGRLFAIYYASGRELDGRVVAENRLVEIRGEGGEALAGPVRVPLAKPFASCFTATGRAGSSPSRYLDLLGPAQGTVSTISYARVRLF